MSNEYYPIKSFHSLLHVAGTERKTTLCGRSTPRHWEFEYMGQAFPVIGKFIAKDDVSGQEGYMVGDWIALKSHFCPKCYKLLKKAL